VKLDKYLITVVVFIAVTVEVQLSQIQVAWLKLLIWMRGRAGTSISFFMLAALWGELRQSSFFSLERRRL